MSVVSEVDCAFRFLRPLCVLVTENHDVEALNNLQEVLDDDIIEAGIIDEMQEYIAFPLRMVLKQFALKDGELCLATLDCLRSLLNKVSVFKSAICVDLFSNLLHFVSPLSPNTTVLAEDAKHSAVDALHSLFKNCTVRCYSSVLKEALPLFGGLISALLDIAVNERDLVRKSSAVDFLLLLVDDRQDNELERLLGRIIPSFLPGITLSVTKIVSAPNEKAVILVGVLKLMYTTLIISLSENSEDDKADKPKLDEKFLVAKTDEWYGQATKNLSLVIGNIATSFTTHTNWMVRREIVDWAYHILLHCHKRVPDCREMLLDTITHNIADDFRQVASRSQECLAKLRKKVDGLGPIIEQRIYDIATKLPRKVTKHDETGSLAMLKIFNGYLSSLDAEVVMLLRSHAHLQRISLALCYLLEFDYTGVSILETSNPEHQPVMTDAVFPVLRRQFTSFTSNSVWREIQVTVRHLVKHGDLYTLVDHFITEYQTNRRHRHQSVLVLNEILTCCRHSEQDIGEEVIDSCSVVLELYSDGYRQLQVDDITQTSTTITQRNENTQLLCLILEGFVAIHQVSGDAYPELLLHSLYFLLESCAHDNILIKQTAITGLHIISEVFHYSGRAELIEKHCNYLCNTLSLNIRRLHRYPTSPSVLCSVLIHSQSTILPYIEQIILEVLLSLDENYTDSALSLLKVPQALLKQLCIWFPSTPSILSASVKSSTRTDIASEANANVANRSLSEVSDTEAESMVISREICDFVKDYYQTRRAAEDIDLSEDNEVNADDDPELYSEEIDELEQIEEETSAKKQTPFHINLAKKVLERCRHLVSHPSAKVRLVTVEMIADGCTVLAQSQDELLPSIHDVWYGLSKRFSDVESLVIMKAISCLSVLADLSKEFIRVRVSKEVLPNLASLLHKKSSMSLRTGKAYRHTLDYKLQLTVLNTLGKLCVDLKLGFPVMGTVVEACLPYISINQPAKLQEVAVSSLLKLAEEDGDFVWFHLSKIVSENALCLEKEFETNAHIIMERIEAV